jgi:MFS family permease
MKKSLHWQDYIGINIHWLGLNIASGSITPILLPYLVTLFVPYELKNTYLATIRVFGLAVAMLAQPIAGMLSDRNTSRWGRRRPYILWGTLLHVLFLVILGITPQLNNASTERFFHQIFGVSTNYIILLIGIVLIQAASNTAFGALVGLIPDLVPNEFRGRSSGFLAVFGILPAFFIIFIGPLVDKGKIWDVIVILMISLLLTMMITIHLVQEKQNREKPSVDVKRRILRLIAMTAIFIIVTRSAVALVRYSADALAAQSVSTSLQIILVGLAGLVGMTGSIFLGVYFGAWVGIGSRTREQTSFIWWVINRLLYLAAVGSIQGFILYYLRDYIQVKDSATMTTILFAAVAVVLIPSAIGGGYLADRMGRKKLVAYGCGLSAIGTFVLLLSTSFPMVILSCCIIGVGAGAFGASNWALGTELIPREEAGRYLGIANLAGAGAGIVGAGLGGPMADFFNQMEPGMGYLVIYAIYGCLFLLSIVTLSKIQSPAKNISFDSSLTEM